MSSILRTCSETEELGGGRFRHVQHLRPVAYLRDGAMRRMGFALAASGDLDMPVGVDEGMLVKFDPRIAGKSPVWEVRAPDRSKLARFALLGANNVAAKIVSPNEYVYPNALDGADLALIYGGHYVAADFRLRAGHPSVVSWRLDSEAGFDPKALTLGELSIRQPVLLPPEGSDIAYRDAASIPLKWAVSEEAGRYRLDCALPDGDWSGWTLDPTLTLQPDAAAGKDTWLSSATEATYNYGTNIEWRCATNRTGLVYFDCSSVPAAAVCTSATFYAYLNATAALGTGTTSLYSVSAANGSWAEGTKLGSLAAAGEPCWNALAADGAGGVTTAWAGSAGARTSGTDYEATAMGSFAFAAADALYKEYTAALSTSRVAGWFGSPNTNYGLLGLAGAFWRGCSSDFATAGYRLKLVVEYTLGGGARVRIVPVGTANATKIARLSPSRGVIGR